MAISQGSNLINVVVHNSADSCNASLSAIILSHVLIERENTDFKPPKSPSSLCAGLTEGGCFTCYRQEERSSWKDEDSILSG